MTSSDQIALGSAITAGVSTLIAIGSFIYAIRSGRKSHVQSNEALEKSKEANKIATGASELSIQSSLSAARKSIHEISIKLTEATGGVAPSRIDAQTRRILDGLEPVMRSSIEDLLNTYELACGLYLDGKVDRERFRRQYDQEIRGVCTNEAESYKQVLKHPPVSKYAAIWKVYEQWHNLEK
jgi:hypothetical protein